MSESIPASQGPHGVRFTARIERVQQTGGWVFVRVPAELAPPVTGPFGMTPVIARVDGREWNTTIWHEKDGRVLLPVPKKVRREKDVGDEVVIEFRVDGEK